MPPYRADKREGRNVCISSRITDAEDDLIDKIATEEDTTRSKIVSTAIYEYLEKKKMGEKR